MQSTREYSGTGTIMSCSVALLLALVTCGLLLLPKGSAFGVPLTTRPSLRDTATRLPTRRRQVAWVTRSNTITREDPTLNPVTREASKPSEPAPPPVPDTLQAALRTFWCGDEAGPRLALGLVFSLMAWRTVLLVPLSGLELLLGGIAVVFWSLQEHFLHKYLLHSPFDWMGKNIHQGHHDKDYYHISIDAAPLMCSWLLIAFGALYNLLPLPLALTTTVAYSAAGLWYEWCHFIVHTRVRFPRNSYFYLLKQHHIKHHLVDAKYWLAFSIRHVDSLFGTNPNERGLRRSH